MFTKIKRSFKWLIRKRIRDKTLLFTRNNITIDRDITYHNDYICARVEIWFDPEKKFGLELNRDEFVKVYAYISPCGEHIFVTYTIYYGDNFIDEPRFTPLTQEEKTLILVMVNETSVRETGQVISAIWNNLIDDYDGAVA